MGVSIYVMPFTRYLTRRFRTTWDARTETAGAAVGAKGNGLSPSEAEEWLRRLKAALGARFVNTDWSEDGDALYAGTMSTGSFGAVADVAGRFAGRARFVHMADPLRPYWIPSRFPRPLTIPDPGGGEEPITVLSSLEAREELTRLQALHQEDPRLREIGSLADHRSERGVLASTLHAATLSVEHRVPVILEG